MGIDAVTSAMNATPVTTVTTKKTGAASSSEAAQDTTAVVYEKSSEQTAASARKTYTPNMELVNKLKADSQARMEQMQSLVNKLFTKQGKAYEEANIFTSDFWKQFAADGGTVDAAAVKQAQADTAEDGYWGVKQTSSRILDFAKAISGGDPDKIDEMERAFEKGYKQAAKAWGDTLPSLCSDTFDAVKKGFSDWRKESGQTITE